MGQRGGLGCQCSTILGSIYMPVKNIERNLHCNLDLKLAFTGKNIEPGSIRGENTPFFFLISPYKGSTCRRLPLQKQ